MYTIRASGASVTVALPSPATCWRLAPAMPPCTLGNNGCQQLALVAGVPCNSHSVSCLSWRVHLLPRLALAAMPPCTLSNNGCQHPGLVAWVPCSSHSVSCLSWYVLLLLMVSTMALWASGRTKGLSNSNPLISDAPAA